MKKSTIRLSVCLLPFCLSASAQTATEPAVEPRTDVQLKQMSRSDLITHCQRLQVQLVAAQAEVAELKKQLGEREAAKAAALPAPRLGTIHTVQEMLQKLPSDLKGKGWSKAKIEKVQAWFAEEIAGKTYIGRRPTSESVKAFGLDGCYLNMEFSDPADKEKLKPASVISGRLVSLSVASAATNTETLGTLWAYSLQLKLVDCKLMPQ